MNLVTPLATIMAISVLAACTVNTSCTVNSLTAGDMEETSHHSEEQNAETMRHGEGQNTAPVTPPAAALNGVPRACVYRMTGDYADNVPVTLGADGSIASYPAVSDITASSRPIELADGWWLDRRGVSDRSVFTRYTYSEYSQLPVTPTRQQLEEAVIPGAWVVKVTLLPVSTRQAVADTAAVNAWIRENISSPRLSTVQER